MLLSRLLPISFLPLLATAQNYTCPDHLYTVHLFSTSPLILYIPNFLTDHEATHLLSVSAPHFRASQIADAAGQQHLASTRTSRSASLASDDVVRCIEARALHFQGLDVPRERLEPLQIVSYGQGETYAPHTDWFTSALHTTPDYGGNRASSFFVYVDASEDLVGGGTQFPLLEAPRGEQWCEYVDCDRGWEEGVTFRAIKRNAVFWRNIEGGKGDGRTLHAGMPVQRGKKVGMNVWTREGELDAAYRSEVV